MLIALVLSAEMVGEALVPYDIANCLGGLFRFFIV